MTILALLFVCFYHLVHLNHLLKWETIKENTMKLMLILAQLWLTVFLRLVAAHIEMIFSKLTVSENWTK